jgi:hypothetical protein
LYSFVSFVLRFMLLSALIFAHDSRTMRVQPPASAPWSVFVKDVV